MRNVKPIYQTRTNPIIAKDRIVPYGGKIGAKSERARAKAALKLIEAWDIGV